MNETHRCDSRGTGRRVWVSSQRQTHLQRANADVLRRDPGALRKLVASLDGTGSYAWDVGVTPVPRTPVTVVHLLGLPP